MTRKRGVLVIVTPTSGLPRVPRRPMPWASRGLAVIMISGVQMWRAGGEPLHDWDGEVDLRGRTAYVCFDADASVI